VRKAQAKPQQIDAVYRPGVVVSGGEWEAIHSFIKPAADAHSLTTPDPLIRFAMDQLQKTVGMEKAQIVVLLTSELMYLQTELPESLFPPDLGFIEIPYSQGNSFFSNINVFHEIGHFVFQRFYTAGRPPFDQLASALSQAVDAHPELKELPTKRQAALRKSLESWTEEVFCDLFATRLIGPAFAFALIDLLWLVGLMKEGNEITFNALHPSPALRVQQLLEQLKDDGWWDQVMQIDAEHVRLLNSLAAIEAHIVDLEEPEPIRKSLFDAFCSVLRAIKAAVTDVTAELRQADPAGEFAEYRAQIEECLANGIVPSAIVGPDLRPGPIAIINAAYVFQLTGLGDLVRKLADPDRRHPAKDRMKLRQKVEAWTMKAIEDFQVLAAVHR